MKKIETTTDFDSLERVVADCMQHLNAHDAIEAALNLADRSDKNPHIVLLKAAYARMNELRKGKPKPNEHPR